jgi:hypothetical protein
LTTENELDGLALDQGWKVTEPIPRRKFYNRGNLQVFIKYTTDRRVESTELRVNGSAVGWGNAYADNKRALVRSWLKVRDV